MGEARSFYLVRLDFSESSGSRKYLYRGWGIVYLINDSTNKIVCLDVLHALYINIAPVKSEKVIFWSKPILFLNCLICKSF